MGHSSPVADRLGYVPNQIARGMITGRTQVVGVILGGVWGKFGQLAIEGIREVLDAEGYTPFSRPRPAPDRAAHRLGRTGRSDVHGLKPV